jgi:monoamine oxidase
VKIQHPSTFVPAPVSKAPTGSAAPLVGATGAQPTSVAPSPIMTSSTPSPLAPLMPTVLPTALRSIDPRTTPVPPALLDQILKTTASHAHLTRIAGSADPATATRLQQGALTLDAFYRLAATSLFGDAAAKTPITYAAFRATLAERGLQQEWRAMLDVMPRGLRDRHLAGKASPIELYAAWAKDRAGWRARVEPVAIEVVRAELGREGRAWELDAALKIMTPGQRARLEAGVMKPAEIKDLLTDASTREADVIIVGAGMAGLAAAQELMAQGKKVVVLEASQHIGGRTKNASVGDVGFDQGAAWIHATDENPLTPIVKQLGLTMIPNDAPLLAYGGKDAPLVEGEKVTEALEAVHHALTEVADKGVDVSAAKVKLPDSPYTQIAKNTIGPLTMGVEWDQMSTLDIGSQPAENHGSTTSATPDMFVKEGLETVTQSFMHGVPVRLGAPVSKVQWGEGGVVVEAGGVKFSGKKILMTASTGVLGSDKIGWDPPLPDWKKDAIQKVPMATFDKIAIRFDKDIFSNKGVQPGAFVYEVNDDTAMDVIIRPTDKNVVVALVGGSYGDSLHKKGVEAAKEALLQKLERIYGPAVREHVTDVAMTNWRADPWQLGSFTATLPGAAKQREKLRAPVDDTLFFAGEAQSMRWGGMLPGAFLTGKQAAGEIASALSSTATTKQDKARAKLRPEAHAAV